MRHNQWRTTLPVLVLTVALVAAIAVGAIVGIQNRRIAEARTMDAIVFRSQLKSFLRQLCIQDAEQGEVLSSILRQSPLRIDPAVRDRYDAAISRLNQLNARCTNQLPDRRNP